QDASRVSLHDTYSRGSQCCAGMRRPAMKPTDVHIESVQYAFEDFRYRTPIKFGGIASDRVTLVNVECRLRTRQGKTARGFGSMPLGNVWSFPSRVLTYDDPLAAMKALVQRIGERYKACREPGHPLDRAAR